MFCKKKMFCACTACLAFPYVVICVMCESLESVYKMFKVNEKKMCKVKVFSDPECQIGLSPVSIRL